MGQNTAPFEVAVGIPQVFVAPVGEAYPDLGAAPAGNWERVAMPELTTEDGVQISAPETIEYDAFRSAGVTAPLKGAVTQEDLEVSVAMMDWSAATLARALFGPDASVTDTAAGSGTAGNLNFNLYRGPSTRALALLVRWPYSTDATDEDDDFAMQLEVPRAFLNRQLDTAFTKGAPGVIGASFRALYDIDAGAYARVRIQDAAPLGS